VGSTMSISKQIRREYENKSDAYSSAIFFLIIMVFGFLVIQRDLAEAESVVCTVRQEILMRVPKGKQRKFPVPFHHIKHEMYTCTRCHHKFYESYTIGSCSVEGCHSDTKKRKGPESFYAAFHKIFDNSDRSCVDCHKTEGKGPTVCKQCHTPR